ncbi:MAG: hypothetical protein JO322_09490 [Candidatus Eremiobacteraeota bacterium]|nr:hypothetical protein [Candidatus Eremiobacteraeota bacterium]
MTAEWLAAIASVATFVVIAATAVAALVQVRHLRNTNQIAVFTELRHRMEVPDFQEGICFIRFELPERTDDPEFRRRLLDRTTRESEIVRDIGNFIDGAIAPLVKHRMVDRTLACDLFYFPVVMCWDHLAPFIATSRAMLGYTMWEDFEYLALLCKNFRARYPEGTYPRNTPRLPLPEPWPEGLVQREHLERGDLAIRPQVR